jgi:hypothetical protein
MQAALVFSQIIWLLTLPRQYARNLRDIGCAPVKFARIPISQAPGPVIVVQAPICYLRQSNTFFFLVSNLT